MWAWFAWTSRRRENDKYKDIRPQELTIFVRRLIPVVEMPIVWLADIVNDRSYLRNIRFATLRG